jgi:hypothetical protein
VLVLSLGCSPSREPEAAATAVPAQGGAVPATPAASDEERPTALRVVGASTMTQVLLGEPKEGGMVDLRPAQAPEGSVFLLVSFISPAPADTKPTLEGARQNRYELRQYLPSETGEEAIAIFEVAGTPESLTLRHGTFSADVPLKPERR